MISRRSAIWGVSALLPLLLLSLACDGTGDGRTGDTPAPAPVTTVSPESTPATTVSPEPTPADTVPPGSPGPAEPVPTTVAANPENTDALVPLLPGVDPTSGVEAEPRIAIPGVDPDEYETIFEVQYLTSATPLEAITDYRNAMAFGPYLWEDFDVIGSGVLFRGVFIKGGGRYVAWIMTFTGSSGSLPTAILIDVAEKTGSGP